MTDHSRGEDPVIRIATLLATAGLLLNTAAMAQDVTYDYNSSADFASPETYAWVPGTNLEDEINHSRIVAAVDAQLAAKGLRKVETSVNADLLVAYHVGVNKDLEVTGSYAGYRPGRWGSARVQEVMVGMLVVDIIDPKTETVIWRGVATKDLDTDAKPEKREKNINKAAEKLFKNYPPAE